MDADRPPNPPWTPPTIRTVRSDRHAARPPRRGTTHGPFVRSQLFQGHLTVRSVSNSLNRSKAACWWAVRNSASLIIPSLLALTCAGHRDGGRLGDAVPRHVCGRHWPALPGRGGGLAKSPGPISTTRTRPGPFQILPARLPSPFVSICLIGLASPVPGHRKFRRNPAAGVHTCGSGPIAQADRPPLAAAA